MEMDSVTKHPLHPPLLSLVIVILLSCVGTHTTPAPWIHLLFLAPAVGVMASLLIGFAIDNSSLLPTRPAPSWSGQRTLGWWAVGAILLLGAAGACYSFYCSSSGDSFGALLAAGITGLSGILAHARLSAAWAELGTGKQGFDVVERA